MVTPRWRSSVAALCWLVVAAGVGWMALQMLGDRVGRWTTSAQALTPWVVPWAIVAAAVATLLARRAAAVTGAVTGIAFLALTAPLAFPDHLPAAAGTDRLTITHANLLYSNPHIDDAITALLATDADVIALSELTPAFADAIADSPIGRTYPYTLLAPGGAAIGLGIWSRVPLVDTGTVPGSTMSLTADIEVAGEPMRLVLAHPLPPLFNGAHWRTEMAALADVPADEQARTVLVADLNVSYYHPPFRRFLDRTGCATCTRRSDVGSAPRGRPTRRCRPSSGSTTRSSAIR